MSNVFVNFPIPEFERWDPVKSYTKALTLRQLADEREYRRALAERARMQMAQDQREEAERQEFKAAVAQGADPQTLIATNPELGFKHLTGLATMQREQRAADTARLTQQQTQQKLTEAQKVDALNELGAIMTMQDPDLKGEAFMNWQAKNQNLKLPVGRGVNWPLNDQGFEFAYKSAMGPDAWLKRAAEAAKNAEERALYPLKVREQLAKTTTAEGEATGTQATSPYQRAQLEQNRWGSTEGLISVLSDPKASEADKERALSGLNKHMELRKAGAASTVITPNQTIANEAKLRDDYIRDTKNYPVIRDSWNKIRRASESHTGPGDISLLYGYMRMLDPGSTVREGEFATAQNAGSIPQQVWAMYNKAINGERLDPTVRAQFVAEAKNIFAQAGADYSKTRELYGGIAERGGMDRRNVVIDLTPATPPKSGTETTSPAGLPKVGDTFQGSRVKSVTKVK